MLSSQLVSVDASIARMLERLPNRPPNLEKDAEEVHGQQEQAAEEEVHAQQQEEEAAAAEEEEEEEPPAAEPPAEAQDQLPHRN